jgi:hypothetical protein
MRNLPSCADPAVNPVGPIGASNRHDRLRERATMNTATRHWTYVSIGVLTGVAGLVLLIAIVAAAGPVGRSVGAIIGGGFAFGLLACALKEALARRSLQRFVRWRDTAVASAAATPVAATPIFVDAKADRSVAVERPSVATVTSLTEIQALRRRSARRRERARATRTGA